jgi:hypothetical protein
MGLGSLKPRAKGPRRKREERTTGLERAQGGHGERVQESDRKRGRGGDEEKGQGSD